MEHLHDLKKFVSEAHRVLKPGGVFVFDTINRSWLSWIFAIQVMQRGFGTPPPGTHDHRMFITVEEAVKLFQENGFNPLVDSWSGMGPVGIASYMNIVILRIMHAIRWGETNDMSISYLGVAIKKK